LEATPAEKKRVGQIVGLLKKEYPEARCSLDHGNALELLVATILSAQCTDERVNVVTSSLFRKYRTWEDYAAAPPAELEADIRPTGFFRNKAKSIQGACRRIGERHGGDVPRSMEELLELPGVARKTANVVAAELGEPQGVVVDTHVRRLSQRLGLTRQEDPVPIERDLVRLVPRADWGRFPHLLIWHGRRVCIARRPLCEDCVLTDLCPSSRV
jgi:endonuclease III